MKYTQDMMLQSESGYCMPFEERDKDVTVTLAYGKQIHPLTHEPFFHHGIDFKASHYLLSAVASGIVTGLGNDSVHGVYQIIRYDDYEVTYAHLSNVFVTYGKQVRAGQAVAVSDQLLHMEVRFRGEELDPITFLTMLYGNLKSMEQQGKVGIPEFVTIDMDVHTAYDKDRKEIEELMIRYIPDYLHDLYKGFYMVPEHTELALRNIFALSTSKGYFFEELPSMANPLGLGVHSVSIAEKVQNLLIGDFLNYMALRHHVYLSSLSALEKKKHTTQP